MNMRRAFAIFSTALAPMAAQATDAIVGTWEARVATEKNPYTLRFTCESPSSCETQIVTAGPKESQDQPIAFKSVVPRANVGPLRDALAYALEHRSDSAKNPEFSAMHKLLAVSVNAKTQVDTCVSLDANSVDFFVVCSVKGAASIRPMLLFFGTMQGLCGHGFCKYVVYPLVKTR